MVALTSPSPPAATDAACVLIVSPNECALAPLLHVLRKAGLRCLVVGSFAKARALLDRHPPALILVDSGTIRGSAEEPPAELREFAGADVPVMLMTTVEAVPASAFAGTGNALDTIVKPVSAREVLMRIDARLRIAALESQLTAERARRIAVEKELTRRLKPGADETSVVAFPESTADDDRRALQPLGLSARETEVLSWMANGKTTREIAVIIGAAVGTVRKHSEHIYAKLGVEGHRGAMLRALEVLQGSQERLPVR